MWSLISSFLFYLEFLVSSGSVSLSVFVSQTVTRLVICGSCAALPISQTVFLNQNFYFLFQQYFVIFSSAFPSLAHSCIAGFFILGPNFLPC